jgi:hypothetical protein
MRLARKLPAGFAGLSFLERRDGMPPRIGMRVARVESLTGRGAPSLPMFLATYRVDSARDSAIRNIHLRIPLRRRAPSWHVFQTGQPVGAALALAAVERGKARMASPTYGLDVFALVLAVILAAAIVLFVARLMPPLADLIMRPPLIGSTG